MVQDLKWAVTAPGLMSAQAQNSEYQFIPDQWFASKWREFLSDFEKLKRDPQPLIEHLSHRRSLGRVGVYFESLLEFFLRRIGGISELQYSVQVGAPITEGELDFSFFDQREARKIHWEVAIKFYLYVPENDRFVGPQTKDRLDLKLHHIRTHQLPVGRRLGCDSRTVLKGALFYPIDEDVKAIQKRHDLSEKGEVGVYYRWSDFLKMDSSLTRSWNLISRLQWLMPIHDSSVLLDFDVLNDKINLEKEPQMLLAPSRRRMFLIPDDWRGYDPELR